MNMVNDSFRYNVGFDDNYHQNGSYQNVEVPVHNHSKKFYDLLEGEKIHCTMVVVKVTSSYL